MRKQDEKNSECMWCPTERKEPTKQHSISLNRLGIMLKIVALSLKKGESDFQTAVDFKMRPKEEKLTFITHSFRLTVVNIKRKLCRRGCTQIRWCLNTT